MQTYELDASESPSTALLGTGMIFFNSLKKNDHKTIKLVEDTGIETVVYNPEKVEEEGLAIEDSSNYIFSQELPWEGIFSINLLISKSQATAGIPFTVYSTSQFAIIATEQTAAVSYEIIDKSGTQVAVVEASVEEPEDSWWPHLKENARHEFFGRYTPQKVELFFQGTQCWLNVVSINDKSFKSQTWECLLPTEAEIRSVGTELDDIRVRNHFGAFRLGYNALTSAFNSPSKILISNVYLVAGTKSLSILRPQIKVPNFTSTQAKTAEHESCKVSWEWSQVNLLPVNDKTLQTALRLAPTECKELTNSEYGSSKGVQFIHSFRNVPEYHHCGSVKQQRDDQIVKTHLCKQSISANVIEFDSILTTRDFFTLAANSEDFSSLIVVKDDDSEASMYLVANHDTSINMLASIREPLHDTQLEFHFNLAVVSFPHTKSTAEFTVNFRLLGQKTISTVFLV
eukprot:CAMPEP_0176458092 /NCGR_PEP_ID=MMETSP0127-20121128/32378_1 /TAXON_ID=938130 /ORGANISM="Platyophrya macrostoma, Strain WH" /LENGTH=456 /DNA_ID=CAMNT_0017848577 /DNA_START=1132 /DNA_END=2498 /DNA_ORIENTATION=+